MQLGEYDYASQFDCTSVSNNMVFASGPRRGKASSGGLLRDREVGCGDLGLPGGPTSTPTIHCNLVKTIISHHLGMVCTTYKHGDDWGMVDDCFNHIIYFLQLFFFGICKPS